MFLESFPDYIEVIFNNDYVAVNSLRARLTPVLAIYVTPVIHEEPDEWQAKEAICSVSTIVSQPCFLKRGFRC